MSNLFSIRCRWLAIFICGMTLTGCASLKTVDVQPIEPSAGLQSVSRNNWWSVRIQWDWPEDSDPAWHLDLFAAHQILLPILNSYQDDIILWRVHRRAGRDDSGHQFSFLFYASGQTAQSVYSDISNHFLIADAMAAGLVRQVRTKALSEGFQSYIEDTSDQAWSPAMQAGWPYYIYGVSRLWLHLVSRTANAVITDSAPISIDETIKVYRRVDDEIDDIWQTEGRHALLHHLNAIFGYEPIPIRF